MIILLATAALALEPGTHTLDMEVVTESKLPVLGKLQVTTRSIALLQITGQDGDLHARQEVCDVQVSSTAGAQTVLPRAFIDALPVTRFDIQQPSPGRFILDQGPQALGYDPALAAAPPSDPDAIGVIDADGDGKPGATVHVHVPLAGRVDIYVTQLAHTRLVGDTDPLGIAGAVDVIHHDQQTLAATHPFFRKSPPALPGPGSHFTLVPTPGASCAGMMAAR